MGVVTRLGINFGEIHALCPFYHALKPSGYVFHDPGGKTGKFAIGHRRRFLIRKVFFLPVLSFIGYREKRSE